MRLIHSLLPRVLLSASSTAEQWPEALSPFNVDEAGVPARLDYRVILLLPCPVLCAQVCMYHWVHVHRRKTSVIASLWQRKAAAVVLLRAAIETMYH